MPQNLASGVRQFLHAFAADSAANNLPATIAHFADTFLAAGPDGAQPVRASDFALVLHKRKQLFDSCGHQSTELLSVTPTPMDARYFLAHTEWRMRFERPDLPRYDALVHSTFLVDTGLPGSRPPSFRIVVYLAHQDILADLREKGFLPG